MPRYGLATLNHSPLHGLPTDWQAHLDAAAAAGFEALAPDIFWLRALEKEGLALSVLADEMKGRGLACMEIAGIALGSESSTQAELEENLRYAEALGAEFVNARFVEAIDDAMIERLRACARAFGEVGTRVALEFSRGTKLRGVAHGQEVVAEAAAEGVGVTLDTWHFFLAPKGPDWEALEALPIEMLANVQLSDGVAYEEGGFGKATMDARRLPGEGEFALERCARLLGSRGFDGAIVIEVLNAELRGLPLGEFAKRAASTARAGFGRFVT